MVNFEYYNPARIVFGKDTESETGRLAKSCGAKRVLLHYGGGSIKRNGLYDKVVDSLRGAGLWFTELGGVKPNPRLSLVRAGIALCREQSIDFILAVGGGSTIDSAKAIAAGVVCKRDIWDYYMDGSLTPAGALPLGVVLTIPAAGSESSDSSVITNEEGNYKRYIGSEYLVPRFAILDPEVTFTMPPAQIANGCSDILAHLMERYFTRTPHVDFTDRLLEASMRTVLENGPLAIKNPCDYNVRAEIMWLGTIAHNNLLGTGRIGDWASHDIEHELSAMYDIAHGAGLAIVFPAWMKYVNKAHRDKFVQLALRVFSVSLPLDDADALVAEMIERLEGWYRRMGLPVRLHEAGVGSDRIGQMAARCVEGRGTVGNFMKLSAEDIAAIYSLAL
ncbi:MAG: iron-containing alcohol dehydrogenase [Rikenellaceae bacterium]|nr:iron-containing alcohol dehydrogenase [Rikenellaceae bacterium]